MSTACAVDDTVSTAQTVSTACAVDNDNEATQTDLTYPKFTMDDNIIDQKPNEDLRSQMGRKAMTLEDIQPKTDVNW